MRYCSQEHLLETEYVVLKLSANSDYKKYATGGKDNGFDNLVKLLEENGYTEYESLNNVLVIYRKERPDASLDDPGRHPFSGGPQHRPRLFYDRQPGQRSLGQRLQLRQAK